MWNYSKAGVDIDARDTAVRGLVEELRKSFKNRMVLLDIGQYANLIDFGNRALVLCTDGVGTKVIVAQLMEKYDTIGIDCVAMNVNDAVCLGAEPLAMVDYIAMAKPEERILREIGMGLVRGADEANIAIVGGETAIVPEIVPNFDLAGTCVGIVEKNRIVDGSAIEDGDTLIGMESSGIHSNGLTLARKILTPDLKEPFGDITVGEELLKPTRIYVKPTLKLLSRVKVKGLAHITGGGISNLKRLNKNMSFEIDSWPEIPEIFMTIESKGKVERREMFRTFNMGIGFCVVVSPADTEETLKILRDYNPGIIGKAVGDHNNSIKIKNEGIVL